MFFYRFRFWFRLLNFWFLSFGFLESEKSVSFSVSGLAKHGLTEFRVSVNRNISKLCTYLNFTNTVILGFDKLKDLSQMGLLKAAVQKCSKADELWYDVQPACIVPFINFTLSCCTKMQNMILKKALPHPIHYFRIRNSASMFKWLLIFNCVLCAPPKYG